MLTDPHAPGIGAIVTWTDDGYRRNAPSSPMVRHRDDTIMSPPYLGNQTDDGHHKYDNDQDTDRYGDVSSQPLLHAARLVSRTTV